eukprot:Rmarinus@m.10974
MTDSIQDMVEEFVSSAYVGDMKTLSSMITTDPRVVELADHRGYTALQLASAAGHVEAVSYLLKSGASTASGGDGQSGTALHNSAKNGHIQVCRLLVENGADINALGSGGKTPLILAAQNAHAAVVEYLLEAGANEAIRDAEGRTAVAWAVYAAGPASPCAVILNEIQFQQQWYRDRYQILRKWSSLLDDSGFPAQWQFDSASEAFLPFELPAHDYVSGHAVILKFFPSQDLAEAEYASREALSDCSQTIGETWPIETDVCTRGGVLERFRRPLPSGEAGVAECVVVLGYDEDLPSYLRRRGVTARREAMVIARSVLASLAEIHEQGLVHLNLRPYSVVRRHDGIWCVSGDLYLVRPHGTPCLAASEYQENFVPPELKEALERGEAAGVTYAMNLFSLAVILGELLLGKQLSPDVIRSSASGDKDALPMVRSPAYTATVEFLAMMLEVVPSSRPHATDLVVHPFFNTYKPEYYYLYDPMLSNFNFGAEDSARYSHSQLSHHDTYAPNRSSRNETPRSSRPPPATTAAIHSDGSTIARNNPQPDSAPSVASSTQLVTSDAAATVQPTVDSARAPTPTATATSTSPPTHDPPTHGVTSDVLPSKTPPSPSQVDPPATPPAPVPIPVHDSPRAPSASGSPTIPTSASSPPILTSASLPSTALVEPPLDTSSRGASPEAHPPQPQVVGSTSPHDNNSVAYSNVRKAVSDEMEVISEKQRQAMLAVARAEAAAKVAQAAASSAARAATPLEVRDVLERTPNHAVQVNAQTNTPPMWNAAAATVNTPDAAKLAQAIQNASRVTPGTDVLPFPTGVVLAGSGDVSKLQHSEGGQQGGDRESEGVNASRRPNTSSQSLCANLTLPYPKLASLGYLMDLLELATPRLFTLLPSADDGGTLVRRTGIPCFRLHLMCEWNGGHLLDERYGFPVPHGTEWLLRLLPAWTSCLAVLPSRLLQHVKIPAEAIAGMPDSGDGHAVATTRGIAASSKDLLRTWAWVRGMYSTEAFSDTDLQSRNRADEAADSVNKLLPSDTEKGENASLGSWLRPLNDLLLSFVMLEQFLLEMDPMAQYANLFRVKKLSGESMWLCPKHAGIPRGALELVKPAAIPAAEFAQELLRQKGKVEEQMLELRTNLREIGEYQQMQTAQPSSACSVM